MQLLINHNYAKLLNTSLINTSLLNANLSNEIKSRSVSPDQELTAKSYIKNGVGVLEIKGVLLNSDSFFSMFFGGVSYDSIIKELNSFAENKDIKSVLLDINSPGGDAHGVSELAEYIKAYSKPIYTYVSGEASSAAYWLASATNKIYTHKTAFVGSIGAYCIIEKNIENQIYIVSEQTPYKLPDLESDEGLSQIKKHMTTLADYFINDVATYRGKEKDFVKENFGRGDIVSSENALGVGMIDGISNLNKTVAMIVDGEIKAENIPATTGENKKQKQEGQTMKKTKKAEFVIVDGDAIGDDIPAQEVTADLIKELFPEVADALINEGKENANTQQKEIDEASAMADPMDEEEQKAVAACRKGEFSAMDLTRKLLTIKKMKLELHKREMDNPPNTATANAHAENAKENGVLLQLKKLRGGK